MLGEITIFYAVSSAKGNHEKQEKKHHAGSVSTIQNKKINHYL